MNKSKEIAYQVIKYLYKQADIQGNLNVNDIYDGESRKGLEEVIEEELREKPIFIYKQDGKTYTDDDYKTLDEVIKKYEYMQYVVDEGSIEIHYQGKVYKPKDIDEYLEKNK